MQKILIFGKGQLGQAYLEYFTDQGWKAKIADGVDVRDGMSVEKAVREGRPDVVLNAAAKTSIDWCEDNREECFAVNTLGADNVGLACQKANIYLVHLSSGCIQESIREDEVWREEDPVNPLCFYSWTKVWAENLLIDRLQHRGKSSDIPNPLKVLILRPRQLLSSKLSPRNALAKMLTYTKFIDTPNSCTIIEDLMWATEKLVEKNATGIFNVVNPGIITPYEVAVMLQKIVKPDMKFEKISKEELNHMTHAKRIDSVLSAAKLETQGIRLEDIHKRLPEILSEFKENLESEQGQKMMEVVAEETQRKLKAAVK